MGALWPAKAITNGLISMSSRAWAGDVARTLHWE